MKKVAVERVDAIVKCGGTISMETGNRIHLVSVSLIRKTTQVNMQLVVITATHQESVLVGPAELLGGGFTLTLLKVIIAGSGRALNFLKN